MSHNNCVSFQELSDYCLGTLDAQRADTVADHVEQCPLCDSTLREFEAQGDAMFATLMRSAEDDPCLREPGLTRTFELAAAIVPAPNYGFNGPSATGDWNALIDHHLRDYQLLARLGQGGMGTVYKATHTRLDKLVAVKLLPPDRTRDPHAVARFQREMRAVGKLEHPHIVAAHDAGEVDGRHYLVMEFVDGLDLAEVAHRAGSLAVADACELARQAALGLDYAHHHGLIHRDIKPSNLMLTTAGQVKILDLGLALLQGEPAGDGELTRLEQVMGTTDYMAPEQAGDSHGVGGSADIYSLGCTLYKLLSGMVPYGGPQFATPMKKLLAHVNAPVPKLAERCVGLPDGLAAVVERMMAKRPDERFASAAEVAAALARFAAGSDLAALFAAVRDDRNAGFARDGRRAVGQAMPDDDLQAASHSIETDAHLSSALIGTAGDLRPAPISALVEPRESGSSGRENSGREISENGRRGPRRGRLLAAAAGAAAVFLLGVVIVVKMRDGTTRTFDVEGAIDSVTVAPKDDGDDAPVPADPNSEVVKWVLDVGGKVSVGEGDLWQATTAISNVSELPDRFGSLAIGLSHCPKVTDADLKRFRSLTKPFGLALGGTSISDDGLADLHGLTNLRYLRIAATKVTRAGLDNLGVLPHLSNVELNGTSTTDADLSLLARFPRLDNVALGQAHLTERGVQVLSTLPNIVALYADDATAVEAERISHLSQLHTLSVGGRHFNDACLEPLGKLTNLISLGLYNTSVTDQGVARLASVAPRLDYLILAGSPVTDAACKELIALPELKRLVLTDCRIGDGGLQTLSVLVGLDTVYLNGTDITDAGLKHLHRLTNLKLLAVTNTQVTAAGVAEVKAALPGCQVER